MNKNHARTAVLTSIVGLILGLVDTILQFVLTTVKLGWISNPGCSAGGCFTSLDFRTYWGVTNMILGFFGVIFTLIFIYDLKKFKFKNFKSIQERN
uniref:Uncharacterized protein n=1 Tax=Acrobeloides nanus TaxID=290746 RepID=A0A914DAT2_9BILA